MTDEPLRVRICKYEDIERLARLNQQLIEDEGYDRSGRISLEGLKDRMSEFIHSGYTAYIFEEGGEVVGYALINRRSDPVRLRQFFICRDRRRQGYGHRAFQELLKQAGLTTVDLDVLAWNKVGIEFWKSLGFETRSICMNYAVKKQKQ
ncbi:MAG TPA: GNAT family N-acetyltransferase [Methanocella sp.]|nr:GNAT family N-acetyltransferase [Methanocella sp.]